MTVNPFFQGRVLYDSLKRMGDLEHKVPTQCVLQKTLYRNGINKQVEITRAYSIVRGIRGGLD